MNESLQQTNGSLATDLPFAAGPQSTRRHTLTPKQQQFFQRQKQALTNIEMGMRGALQLLVEDKALSGKVSLSEDCTELIEEPEVTP